MKLKAIAVSVLLVFFVSLFSQDSTFQKSVIALSPISLLDKTVSISYYKPINDKINLIINPRFRAALFDPLIYWEGLFGYDNHFIYSRALLRNGVQFHGKHLFFEPLIQEDFGWANDRSVTFMDDERIYSMNLRYFSIGMISSTGWIIEKERNYTKIYIGIGIQHSFRRHIITDYFNKMYPEDLPVQPYREVLTSTRTLPSVHLGIEYGFIFNSCCSLPVY